MSETLATFVLISTAIFFMFSVIWRNNDILNASIKIVLGIMTGYGLYLLIGAPDVFGYLVRGGM